MTIAAAYDGCLASRRLERGCRLASRCAARCSAAANRRQSFGTAILRCRARALAVVGTRCLQERARALAGDEIEDQRREKKVSKLAGRSKRQRVAATGRQIFPLPRLYPSTRVARANERRGPQFAARRRCERTLFDAIKKSAAFIFEL